MCARVCSRTARQPHENTRALNVVRVLRTGYLSNSARDTHIMNPSGSVLVHELLGRDAVCSRRHPDTGLPPLVVDVGAHVGWFSMLAASYGCRVLSFEPQPHAHPFLNASITLNGWQGRVRTVWGAVSSQPHARMKMVNRHGWDNWDVTELVSIDDPDEGDEVPVWRVDDFVHEVLLVVTTVRPCSATEVSPSPPSFLRYSVVLFVSSFLSCFHPC